MQADESKVKALENIFGGDITASVIRTVLSTNENKFDEAVDSLLNMSNDSTTNPQPKPPQEDEQTLLDLKEREKIKTLENMFGNDLSNSVICTVLESNKGELVDTVDTLLNMTSKDINPTYQATEPNQQESERLKNEEELRNYEQFKALQIKLQEEEVRAERDQKRMNEELVQKKAVLAVQEETVRKEMMQEQERLVREFEAQKRAQEDLQNATLKVEQERRRVGLEQEQLRLAALNIKMKEEETLQAEARRRNEEEQRKKETLQAEARRRSEEEQRKKELDAQEETLRQKVRQQEEALLRFRAEEERKLFELRRCSEQHKAEEAARMRLEVIKQEQQQKALEAMIETHRIKEERTLREKTEVERQAQAIKLQEERQADLRRRALEEERINLQKERELVEQMRRDQENKIRLKAEAKARKEEDQRIAAEVQEREKNIAIERRKLEEEEARLVEEAILREEEERRMREQERSQREEAEQRRAAEEEVRLKEEEVRRAVLKEEAERQSLLIEEERKRKIAYDQIAASAVFIPPKAEASSDAVSVTSSVQGDAVTCTWDLPEGNAAITNWLGLYPSHQPLNTNKYVQFVYTNGTHTGQHVFRGVTPGHYEVRFFATRGYDHVARGSKIRVGPAATLMCQQQGEHLRVHYTFDAMSSSPTRDWLGVYEKTQRRNKKYLSSAYGNAEGQVLMKVPRTPGTYEVRLFAAGAVYNDQARIEFTVVDNDCVMSDASFANAGTSVSVSWVLRTLEPSSSDWVGLYRADEPNNSSYISCTYTQGASVGVASVQVPKEVGVYEFRLFVRAKGKYTTFRTSQPLTIIPA